MRLKYILDEYGNFALFSDVNTHSDMARGFYKKPVSAGFCDINSTLIDTINAKTQIYVECHGESISLNIKSRPEDGEIITKKFNGEEY